MAPAVVAHIMSDGRLPLPSGVRLPVIVLFADIRGFTRLAERLAAEHVVALLDDYFDAMSGAVLAHAGVIDKLIGDAVMVVYGLPAPRGNEADRVLRTALDMHRRFAGVIARWSRRLPPRRPLGLGVGCAAGDAVLANVGSAARMDYTVIGPPVNLAARLAASAPSGVTLIDQAVRARVSADLGRSTLIRGPRPLAVKGMGRRVAVWACRGRVVAPPPRGARSTEDPVCGMKVDRADAVTVAHGGRRYHFCSPACAGAFARTPEAYLARRRRRGRAGSR